MKLQIDIKAYNHLGKNPKGLKDMEQ